MIDGKIKRASTIRKKINIKYKRSKIYIRFVQISNLKLRYNFVLDEGSKKILAFVLCLPMKKSIECQKCIIIL